MKTKSIPRMLFLTPGQIMRAGMQTERLTGIHGVCPGFISFQELEGDVLVQDPSNSIETSPQESSRRVP